MLFLNVCCVFVYSLFCYVLCVLYGQFCHGAHKLDIVYTHFFFEHLFHLYYKYCRVHNACLLFYDRYLANTMCAYMKSNSYIEYKPDAKQTCSTYFIATCCCMKYIFTNIIFKKNWWKEKENDQRQWPVLHIKPCQQIINRAGHLPIRRLRHASQQPLYWRWYYLKLTFAVVRCLTFDQQKHPHVAHLHKTSRYDKLLTACSLIR